MANEDRQDLDYTSLTRGYEQDAPIHVEDQENYSALRKAQNVINEAYSTARDNRSLNAHDPKYTIDEQLLGFQFALETLDIVKNVIDSTIDEINKQQGGVNRK